MADIFAQSAGGAITPAASPFVFKLTGDRMELVVGGTPVDLKLLQHVRIDVDARDLVPVVQLTFIPTSVDAELPAAEVREQFLPMPEGVHSTQTFVGQVIRDADVARAIAECDAALADAPPVLLDCAAFPVTRDGLMDALKAFSVRNHLLEATHLHLDAAAEAALGRWSDDEYGGPNPFRDGGRPATLAGCAVVYDAPAFALSCCRPD
jgi:hypothetical protein